MSEQVQEFITCSCQTEILYILKYHGDEETYFSIFSRGLNPVKMTFTQKLRYIWRVLYKGKPFEDELVLNQKDIKRLIVVLKKCLHK